MPSSLLLVVLVVPHALAAVDSDDDFDDVMLLQSKAAHLQRLTDHAQHGTSSDVLFGNDETRPFKLIGHGFFCGAFPLFGKPRFTPAECHQACANRTDCKSFVTYEHSSNPVSCYALPHNCPKALQIKSNRSGVISAYRRVPSKQTKKLAAKIGLLAGVIKGMQAQKHAAERPASLQEMETETRSEVSRLEQRMSELKATVEKLQTELATSNSTVAKLQTELETSNSTATTTGQLSMQDVAALVAEVKELKKENAELKSAQSASSETKDAPPDAAGCFMEALQAQRDWSTMRACFEV